MTSINFNRIFLIIVIVFLLLAISGCQKGSGVIIPPLVAVEDSSTNTVGVNTTETAVAPKTTIIPPEMTNVSCKQNSDCSIGSCINSKCSDFDAIYGPVPNCAKKCNYNLVELSTSDGEKYTLPPGQGSYSYAGALEWKINPLPDYCLGQEPKVAIEILAKTTGKVLQDYYFMVGVGGTTPIATHPSIKRVQFKITVDKVTEKCS